MNYEIITFKFHPTLSSYAEVMHVPNWVERTILQKRNSIVTYSGNTSCWMNNATYDFAPYKLATLLTEEFHKQNLEYFKNEVLPKCSEFAKSFLAFIFKNKNQ